MVSRGGITAPGVAHFRPTNSPRHDHLAPRSIGAPALFLLDLRSARRYHLQLVGRLLAVFALQRADAQFGIDRALLGTRQFAKLLLELDGVVGHRAFRLRDAGAGAKADLQQAEVGLELGLLVVQRLHGVGNLRAQHHRLQRHLARFETMRHASMTLLHSQSSHRTAASRNRRRGQRPGDVTYAAIRSGKRCRVQLTFATGDRTRISALCVQ
jgi:hypothetical protein